MKFPINKETQQQLSKRSSTSIYILNITYPPRNKTPEEDGRRERLPVIYNLKNGNLHQSRLFLSCNPQLIDFRSPEPFFERKITFYLNEEIQE